MPQETDAITGNFVGDTAPRADPQPAVPYRTGIAVADGAAKPAPAGGLFLQNPGYRGKARVFVSSTGSPTTCTLRPYLLSGGQTGALTAVSLNGAPNFDALFDVQADGDAIAILVESLAGGTSPAVSIYVSWR